MQNKIETKTFKYELLDSNTAEFLKSKELNVKTIASTMINQIGKELKEAQDKLAGNNQYDGLFEKWYTSLGFKKRTVYNYINKYNYLARATNAQAEIIEELPSGLAYEVTKPTADKEVNERVFKGDITSLKEYKEVEKENNQLRRELEDTKSKHNDLLNKNIKLEEREPEVIEKEVEKIPDDYYRLKNKEKNLENEISELRDKVKNQTTKEENEKLRKELSRKSEEVFDLQEQIKQITYIDSEAKHQEKLKDTAVVFATRVHTFLNDVGGLAWLTEYIDELDDYDKRSYLKAIDLLEGWVLTVKSNINKEE